eukprot:Partr_v1_DN26895_c3_g1_i1_m40721 putative cell division cycle 40 homolog (S. cerevisiae)
MQKPLVQYEDSDSDGGDLSSRPMIDAAPDVPVEQSAVVASLDNQSAGRDVVAFNVPYDQLYRPIQGPTDMFTKPMENIKNTFTGHVEAYAIPAEEFENRRRTFNNYGYVLDPAREFLPVSAESYVGDRVKAVKYRGASVIEDLPEAAVVYHAMKKRRLSSGAADDVEGFRGPWAGFEDEDAPPTSHSISAEEDSRLYREAEEVVKMRLEEAAKKVHRNRKNQSADSGAVRAASEWISPPVDVGIDLRGVVGSRECFPSKRHIFTFTGHTRGVNTVRFQPQHGHLVLSASMDCTVKIWDVYHSRALLHTYTGHEKSIRDICFSHDGRQFLSCGYDKTIKRFDVETGACIQSFSSKSDRISQFTHWQPDSDSVFLSGGSDGMVFQYDCNSKDSVVSTFAEHTGPVSSLVFVDGGSKFITTSDDKSIKTWDLSSSGSLYSFADSNMDIISSTALHPSGRSLSAAVDNQIVVYDISENFQVESSRKKRFPGILTAGYSCQIAFSPDGRYLTSGDSTGELVFWNWKTARVSKKIRAHLQCCSSVSWSPQDPAKVVSASWDGTCKLWDQDSKAKGQ